MAESSDVVFDPAWLKSKAEAEPSPYCSLYITRRQMEAVRAALRGEKVKKRDAAAALRWVEEALG